MYKCSAQNMYVYVGLEIGLFCRNIDFFGGNVAFFCGYIEARVHTANTSLWAIHFSVWGYLNSAECVTVCCSVLQYVAVCCSVPSLSLCLSLTPASSIAHLCDNRDNNRDQKYPFFPSGAKDAAHSYLFVCI